MPSYIFFPALFILAVLPAICALVTPSLLSTRGYFGYGVATGLTWLLTAAGCIGLCYYGYYEGGFGDVIGNMWPIIAVVNVFAIVGGFKATADN